MKVENVMTNDVWICGINDDLQTAARTMCRWNCGALPVVWKDAHVIGMITDRDICIAAASKNIEPSRICVSDVMSKTVHGCAPEDDVQDALESMRRHRVRRLPVIDADGKLTGILSLDDVATKVGAMARPGELSREDVERTLEAICQRSPRRHEVGHLSAA